MRNIKKVLLINPPLVIRQDSPEISRSFPLGLASIAAVLKKSGVDVKILDCFSEGFSFREPRTGSLLRIGLPDKEVEARLRRFAPDLVGMTIPFSCQLPSALQMGALVKLLHKDIVLVAGGNHATAAPETIPGDIFDWVILGEGEYRLEALIKALNNEESPESSGILRPADAKVLSEDKRRVDLIEDLDSLPFPQYDLLPLERYWQQTKGKRWINMMVTRGCPYECVFCSIHNVMGKRVRTRSADKVSEELRFLKQRYDIQDVYFEDDNLTFDSEWAKKLFERIIKERFGFGIYLRNGIRADKVDRELLRLMKRSGVVRVAFAPESGSQETLDRIIKKRLKIEDTVKAVRLAKREGLDVTCFLVIGFPEEDMESIEQTLAFGRRLRKAGCDTLWISCAVPYPGTELYGDCVKRGIFSPASLDYQRLSPSESVIHNEWFSAQEITKIARDSMLELNRHTLQDSLRAAKRRVKFLAAHPGRALKKVLAS